MIERLVWVVEINRFTIYTCLKLISIWVHPRQPRLCIRLPRVQHIQIVLTATHLAQVLNAVVTLVAIDVVYLLRRPTALADRPDSMVQINKELSLVQACL